MRNEERQLTQLAMGGITTAEARSCLENMPTPEELLPPIRQLQLRDGDVVMLDAEQAVTPDAKRNALVTAERNGVTGEVVDCNACAICGNPLIAGRGLYCSNACRQKAWRRRHV
jgi:hypothetical protein